MRAPTGGAFGGPDMNVWHSWEHYGNVVLASA
jgi:hypothetical protein